jgi:hypothetical protein
MRFHDMVLVVDYWHDYPTNMEHRLVPSSRNVGIANMDDN